jgi:hypothetical protein
MSISKRLPELQKCTLRIQVFEISATNYLFSIFRSCFWSAVIETYSCHNSILSNNKYVVRALVVLPEFKRILDKCTVSFAVATILQAIHKTYFIKLFIKPHSFMNKIIRNRFCYQTKNCVICSVCGFIYSLTSLGHCASAQQ